MIKIAVDAMGGDYGVATTVPASMDAIKKFKDIEIVLFGDETKIQPLLKNSERISIVHTDSVIDMGEHDPVRAIRNGKTSSLVMAMKACKEGTCDCVVTSGPTQCVVVGSHLIIKRLDFMSRAALCPIIPSMDGKGRLMLDVGANIELRPEHLVELGIYATVLAKEVCGFENPRVGLLNIGTEEGKGRENEREAYDALKACPLINFYGNVETNAALTTECEILLTDGFTGNMVMKAIEGTAKTGGAMLKEEIKKSLSGIIGYLFARKAFKRYKERLSGEEVGGAMVIGINNPVIKAHGSSSPYAFYHAIRQARNYVNNDVIRKVCEKMPKKEETNE